MSASDVVRSALSLALLSVFVYFPYLYVGRWMRWLWGGSPKPTAVLPVVERCACRSLPPCESAIAFCLITVGEVPGLGFDARWVLVPSSLEGVSFFETYRRSRWPGIMFSSGTGSDYTGWMYIRTPSAGRNMHHDLTSRRKSSAVFPNIVNINVGGFSFKTSLSTVRSEPNSALARMFSEEDLGLNPTQGLGPLHPVVFMSGWGVWDGCLFGCGFRSW